VLHARRRQSVDDKVAMLGSFCGEQCWDKKAMNTNEDFAYVKMIAVLEALAKGKGLHENVAVDYGRRFEIIRVLKGASALSGDFADDHIDLVKAAFAKVGKRYPGNRIADCVAALLEG